MFQKNRKAIRLKLKEGTMVGLTPFGEETHYIKFGQIIDFSTRGLAFEYDLSVGYVCAVNTTGFVDIIGMKKLILVENIPYKVVYNRKTISIANQDNKESHRCGLEFGVLSEVQVSQINLVLNIAPLIFHQITKYRLELN